MAPLSGRHLQVSLYFRYQLFISVNFSPAFPLLFTVLSTAPTTRLNCATDNVVHLQSSIHSKGSLQLIVSRRRARWSNILIN
jgi:hypothetical protein